ncbi:MAG: hypothetical protein V1763_00335, partial [Parcubacteria group bacterium]
KLRPDEKAEHIIFHHSIIIVPHRIVCALILVLDFFMMYFLFLQGLWGVSLFTGVIAVVAFYTFRLFFLFRHNALIITNERLIDVERTNFFEEFVSDYPFTEIRKVEAVRRGLFSRMGHYGNLKLIVAKEPKPFELYKIPTPERWQKVIEEKLSIKNTSASQAAPDDSVRRVLAEVSKLNEEEKEELKKALRE